MNDLSQPDVAGAPRNVFAELTGQQGDDFERYLMELQKCMRCGQCRTNCPVFRFDCGETDVARGKLALLSHYLRPEAQPDRELYGRLTRCVNCGRCRLECPSGTDTGYALLEGRARLLEKVGMPPVKSLAVRGAFAHYGRLRAAARAFRLVQPLAFRPRAADPRHLRSVWKLPILGQRVLLPRLRGPARTGVIEPPDGREVVGSVIIYPGCLVDLGYPELLEATLKVVGALGFRAIVPTGLVCCGAPAVYSGDSATGRRLAVENLKLLLPHLREGADRLLFLCPSCSVAFKHDYPEYLFGKMAGSAAALAASGLSQADIQLVAEMADDASRWAWERGARECLAAGAVDSVTYHDPCHLRRLMAVVEEPRAILRHLAGDGYAEAPNPDSCCGFGGTFALEHVGASGAMLEQRCHELASTEAELVATACPGCLAWLANGLDRIGSRQRPVHLIELMASAVPAEGSANHESRARQGAVV